MPRTGGIHSSTAAPSGVIAARPVRRFAAAVSNAPPANSAPPAERTSTETSAFVAGSHAVGAAVWASTAARFERSTSPTLSNSPPKYTTAPFALGTIAATVPPMFGSHGVTLPVARADGRESASRTSADRCKLTREVDDLPVRAGNRDRDVAVDLRRPRRCPTAGQVDCRDTLALLFADCREGTRRVENATRRSGQGRDRAARRKSPSDLAASRVERKKHRPGLLPRAGEVAGDIEQRRAGDRPERTRRPAQAQPEREQAAGPSVKRSKPMPELAGDLRELTADDQRVPSKRESRNRSSAGRRLPSPVDRTIAPKMREPSTRDAADAAKVAREIPTAAAVRTASSTSPSTTGQARPTTPEGASSTHEPVYGPSRLNSPPR